MQSKDGGTSPAHIAQALSNITVTISDTTIEPTKPRPLEKKKNIDTSFATTKKASARSILQHEPTFCLSLTLTHVLCLRALS
jgi:hypothetical protein